MPEIVDLDELVPDDIVFKYKKHEYTIPGDLKTGTTLDLFALLQRLATAEAKGGAAELKRIVGKAETALLPIFQVYQPDMDELPFGAAALGHVLRRVLALIGMLQEGEPAVDPPNRAARRARKKPPARSTRTQTKTGSRKPPKTRAPKVAPSGGSSRSKSS